LAGTLFANEKHYFHNWTSQSFTQEAVTYPGYLDGKEYLTEAYDTNGTVLRRSEQNFAQRAPVPWWGAWQGPRGPDEPPNDTRLTDATATLADVTPNLVAKQEYSYDQFNNRRNTWEYDFAPDGAFSYPIRHTRTNYLVVNEVNNVDYTGFAIGSPTDSIHLRSLPREQLVYAVNQSTGADIQPAAAQTTFEYDKYDSSTNHAPLVNRSGISGHDAGFGTGRETRGNATAISRWLDTTSSWVTISQQYDIAGSIVKKVDARGFATIIDFADHFGAPNGDARANTSPSELSSVSQTSFAFPTSVTNPLQHTTYTQYDYCAAPHYRKTTPLLMRPGVFPQPLGLSSASRNGARSVTIALARDSLHRFAACLPHTGSQRSHQPLTYDNAGNVQVDGAGGSFVYDAENRRQAPARLATATTEMD
jgi:hypothetical protein